MRLDDQTHVMLDLETLGLDATRPLFQIGLVAFQFAPTRPSVIAEGHWDLNLLDVILQTGFIPDAGTVKWWGEQEYDPVNNHVVGFTKGMESAVKFIQTYLSPKGMIWANSPQFDHIILKAHLAKAGLQAPWSHKQEADFRTVKWIYKEFLGQGEDMQTPSGIPHRAVDDSRGQTIMLNYMMNQIQVSDG